MITRYGICILAICSAILHTPESVMAQRAIGGESFLSTTFIEGVPYDEARLAGQLFWHNYVKVLSDPGRETVWGNAVVAIGASGEPGAEKAIADFFMRLPSDTPLSPVACRAASAVPIALAYHMHKSRSSYALQFLARLAEGSTALPWRCNYHSSREQAQTELQALAVRSLGLSGTPEAGKALGQLELRVLSSEQKEALAQARELYSEVQRLGLSEFYNQRGKDKGSRSQR